MKLRNQSCQLILGHCTATIISFEIQRVGTKIPKVGTKIRTSRN